MSHQIIPGEISYEYSFRKKHVLSSLIKRSPLLLRNCAFHSKSEMVCGFPPAEGQKRRKTFFSHAAGSMDLSAWGVSGHVRSSRITLHLPSWHPPTHAWSISRVGLSLCVLSFASLPKFFRLNQLIMYSFLLVFLDSVSSSWPVFVLLYLSFCVNKGQAACSAWHGSQLCVRTGVYTVNKILYGCLKIKKKLSSHVEKLSFMSQCNQTQSQRHFVSSCGHVISCLMIKYSDKVK